MDKRLYALLENVAEMSSQFIGLLQEIIEAPRSAIIAHYIIPWAEEAERVYSTMSEEERDVLPYYDFIDGFTARKIREEFGITPQDTRHLI